MEKKLVGIGEAAKALGVAPGTLRRWEKTGTLVPDERTAGGKRRYDLYKLRPELVRKNKGDRKTIAYARVSSHDQREDLRRQCDVLEYYCSARGWSYDLVSDFGSGMNYKKKGLKSLLNGLMDESVGRLVITHKDRLLRFGAELVFALCEAKNVEVVIINQGEETSFEEDLAQDVLEIITVFSARLHGSRSRKNVKLLDQLKAAALDAKGGE